jgi:hypothetical protein
MKRFSTACLAFAALLAPIAAQQSIVPYLPKETVAVFAMPDLAGSMERFQRMPLARMWAEKDVQLFVADLKEMVGKQLADGIAQLKEMHAGGGFPIDPEHILALRIRGGTLAVTGMKLRAGDHEPQFEMGLLLHLDFGDSAPTWNALIQMGLSMLEAEAGGMLTKRETKIGDVAVVSFLPPEHAPTPMGLNVAMIPGGVLIGTLASEVHQTVAAMNAKTPMLGASSHYQATAKHIDASGADVEMFVQPNPMVRFVVDALHTAEAMQQLHGVTAAGVERALQAMGMLDLGAMGATSKYVDGKCVSRSFSTGTDAAKAIDMSFLRWVPKDAVSFGAGSMAMDSLYDTLVRGIEAYDADMAKHLLGQLGELEKQLGFSLRNDLFGAIGDHYYTWSMPMGTVMGPPEMAFLLRVNDEKKLLKSLQGLAKMTGGVVEIEGGERRGVQAYEVRLNLDGLPGMGGVNPLQTLQPTFAFKNGYMLLGFSASDLKRITQRMDRADDPKGDIRSNKEFAAIAASLPAEVTSISFTDWKASFESLYQIVSGVLAFVPMGDEVPIDMSLLPDAATLTKHLFPAVSWTKVVQGGTESVSTGPFGPEVGIMVGGVAAGAMAFFAGTRVSGGF